MSGSFNSRGYQLRPIAPCVERAKPNHRVVPRVWSQSSVQLAKAWPGSGRSDFAAPRSAGLAAARVSALPHLTCRICLSAVNEVNVASYAAGRKTEHHRGVAAQRRPPQSERGTLSGRAFARSVHKRESRCAHERFSAAWRESRAARGRSPRAARSASSGRIWAGRRRACCVRRAACRRTHGLAAAGRRRPRRR